MEPQNQKQALRRLVAVSKMIPLEHFYSITITGWGNVTLQGKFNSKVIALALANKFTNKINSSMGYVELDRGKINITLT
jgi:hypothetical protein